MYLFMVIQQLPVPKAHRAGKQLPFPVGTIYLPEKVRRIGSKRAPFPLPAQYETILLTLTVPILLSCEGVI